MKPETEVNILAFLCSVGIVTVVYVVLTFLGWNS